MLVVLIAGGRFLRTVPVVVALSSSSSCVIDSNLRGGFRVSVGEMSVDTLDGPGLVESLS